MQEPVAETHKEAPNTVTQIAQRANEAVPPPVPQQVDPPSEAPQEEKQLSRAERRRMKVAGRRLEKKGGKELVQQRKQRQAHMKKVVWGDLVGVIQNQNKIRKWIEAADRDFDKLNMAVSDFHASLPRFDAEFIDMRAMLNLLLSKGIITKEELLGECNKIRQALKEQAEATKKAQEAARSAEEKEEAEFAKLSPEEKAKRAAENAENDRSHEGGGEDGPDDNRP